jgi:periplasmic mercuric ion binding protein
MKKLIVTAFLAFAPLSLFAAEQTVDMSIEKMTCALCPVTVRKAMEQVDGVVEVEVDYETKLATVTYDDSDTTAAEIAQASTDVGYPATPVRE